MECSYHHGMRYIPDSVFIELGFANEIDVHGIKKVKKQGILYKYQQQAKCLTTRVEIASRENREEDIELELKRTEVQTKARDKS